MNRQEQIEAATATYINGRLKNNVPPEEIEEIRLAYQAGAIYADEHPNGGTAMTQDREQQMLKASQLYPKHQQKVFVDGVLWGDRNPQDHWHDAQGDDLPLIDKEVIVLRSNGQIAFGHRPNPDGEIWKHPDGTLEHVYFETYDKGGWNIPNVKWWLDIDIPVEEGGEG